MQVLDGSQSATVAIVALGAAGAAPTTGSAMGGRAGRRVGGGWRLISGSIQIVLFVLANALY